MNGRKAHTGKPNGQEPNRVAPESEVFNQGGYHEPQSDSANAGCLAMNISAKHNTKTSDKSYASDSPNQYK